MASITINGKEYGLRFDMYAMEQVEEEFGSVKNIFDEMRIGKQLKTTKMLFKILANSYLSYVGQEETVTGDEIRIPPLVLPDPPDTMLEWGLALPPLFRGSMREHLISKPVVDPKKCVGCGLCVKMCPPKSLRLQDGKPAFRYSECIRCYCCQEHCPKGAIRPKRPLSMRVLEAMERGVRAAFRRTGH